MDAQRCWAGRRKGATNGKADVLAGVDRSDDARRTALSRGGMAADGDSPRRDALLGGERDAKKMVTKQTAPRGLTLSASLLPPPCEYSHHRTSSVFNASLQRHLTDREIKMICPNKPSLLPWTSAASQSSSSSHCAATNSTAFLPWSIYPALLNHLRCVLGDIVKLNS